MIEIVGKGYKFILKQFDDFSGVQNKTVISLKSADGRKKYEEVFKRKPLEKVKYLKTRILSVFQLKLTDYSRKIIRIIRKCQNLVIGNLQIIFKEPDNDNTIFKNTVTEGMRSTKKRPSLLLSDAGPDSHDSNKLVLGYGIIPVIAARSNSVGDVL